MDAVIYYSLLTPETQFLLIYVKSKAGQNILYYINSLVKVKVQSSTINEDIRFYQMFTDGFSWYARGHWFGVDTRRTTAAINHLISICISPSLLPVFAVYLSPCGWNLCGLYM